MNSEFVEDSHIYLCLDDCLSIPVNIKDLNYFKVI